MQKQFYRGKELQIDGYYYYQQDNTTKIKFFYRNGVILSGISCNSLDLNTVEQEMLNQYNSFHKNKIGWGIFQIIDNKINIEVWTTSVGGGLPIFRWYALIENDTTFRVEYSGEVYHFRQFFPKPDSTNQWIK
jgi:hypothetical protein